MDVQVAQQLVRAINTVHDPSNVTPEVFQQAQQVGCTHDVSEANRQPELTASDPCHVLS